ncbi:MAG: polyprenyl synthetase family protein [Flavobacteriaceae bacterium]|nr:polyprenyl synthetase family protein [Bacteroidia bacterium]NNK88693.1 polyprenyl synthetase family protein [Flavobacteriaceae bacterium]
MQQIDIYRQAFMDHLSSLQLQKEPKALYAPIEYILNLGGKRMRPVLTLMAAELFGADHNKALNAALAVEVFHNFTLIHDDIMDEAPLRRGQPTVHHKWDLNTGILSGDAMLILAYRCLESYEPIVMKVLLSSFNKTALEVCEGQQYDIDFETRNDVTISEYIRMIEYKTAVLVGMALKFGAIIAGASESDQDRIENFGIALGTAFQLQDDYLDAFGDPESFGKKVGGDIVENKKTFLFLKAKELASEEQKEELSRMFTESFVDEEKKITRTKAIMKATGADTACRETIEQYTAKAFDILDETSISEKGRMYLKAFGNELMYRTN